MIARLHTAMAQSVRMSDLAVAKLKSSGISVDIALAAGIFSVEDAQTEVHQEFAAVPALVFQYHDIAGKLVYFERDGELLQFVRVRYLAEPPAKGFIKHKLPKYMQLRASGVHAYFPRVAGFDWQAIAADPKVNIVITEGELKALSLCANRQPAIGIGGVDCFLYRQELRK